MVVCENVSCRYPPAARSGTGAAADVVGDPGPAGSRPHGRPADGRCPPEGLGRGGSGMPEVGRVMGRVTGWGGEGGREQGSHVAVSINPATRPPLVATSASLLDHVAIHRCRLAAGLGGTPGAARPRCRPHRRSGSGGDARPLRPPPRWGPWPRRWVRCRPSFGSAARGSGCGAPRRSDRPGCPRDTRRAYGKAV